jgi:peptide/nickel transport system permease protein
MIVSSSSSRPAPTTNQFERLMWSFMRLSGLVMVVLIFIHLLIMHFTTDIADVNGPFVFNRFAATPIWMVIDLLILFFAVELRWVSAGGFPGWSAGLWPALKALILPAVALAAVQAAILARIIRSAVLDVSREDFVRTARAKGLSPGATLRRHVLRNAMIPIVTIMGLQFANLIAGAIVVENVFYLPGLGRLMFQSISNRDIAVVRDVVMLLAGMVVLVNFAVDLLYAAIDPRLRAHDV